MIWENMQLAFSSLTSNKMRALLTMLGIIIGIMSIITIVIIGDALTASVSGELAALGGDSIMINVRERGSEEGFGDDGFDPDSGMSAGAISLTGRTPLSEDLISSQMIADMRAYFGDDIQSVSISYSGESGEVRDLELYADVSVNGVNADYFFVNNVELLAGRLISDSDLSETSSVAVVSDRLAEKMFSTGTDPIGQQIRLFRPSNIEIFTIIGIYRFEESGFMGSSSASEDTPTTFYMPLTTAMHGSIERNFTAINVLGSAETDVHDLTESLQIYFDGVYESNEFWSISVMNMASMLETISSTLGTISLAIAFIAGISLLVGGIGVMNIMLVSVTERTREIGTRKALGAKNFHIRIQFVIESLIVALAGGIIGMILGIVLGGFVSGLFGAPLVISPTVVISSMLFAMAIGVFFGLYPANKAAKLNPIDALRYE